MIQCGEAVAERVTRFARSHLREWELDGDCMITDENLRLLLEAKSVCRALFFSKNPQVTAQHDPNVFDDIANLVSAKESEPDSLTSTISIAVDRSEYWSDKLKPLARKCTLL